MSFKHILNRGTGAGGANTVKSGILFENKILSENRLLRMGYKKRIINSKIKNGYYLEHIKNKNEKHIHLTQTAFKLYFKEHFNIQTYRKPDEAYLIIKNNKYYLKILEKKNQNVEGSIEDKLKTGNFNKKEYELMLNSKKHQTHMFNISYAFSVSKFLQDKFESGILKYVNIKKIMAQDNIQIFYGAETKYFDVLIKWFRNV
jgi:hypothetical protein